MSGFPGSPEQALGWSGFPGVYGHHDDGSGWSPLFTTTPVRHEDASGADRVVIEAADIAALLGLRVAIEMLPSGLVRGRAALTNTSMSEPG